MPYEEHEMKDRPGAFLGKLPALYRAASEAEMTLSQFLEQEDPSHEWQGEDRRLRAFGRVLQASGFRFRSDPAEGLWADTYEKISNSPEGRALLPEWANSVWRRTIHGGYAPQVSSHARIIGSGEELVGGPLRPIVDAAQVYQNDLEPGIGLDDILAMTTPINGDTYRRPYLDDSTEDGVRLRRIQEKSDIPRATIELSDHVIRTFKYGRGIESSYETIRRIPVDKVALFLARAAIQVETDRVAQGIDVLINGDGNAGTAATNYTVAALDTGTVLTIKAWIAFKAKFKPPYQLTHVFAREADLVNLQMLQMPNNNPFLVQIAPDMGFGGIRALQDLNGAVVLYGQTDAVPAGVYLGIDRRFALERVTEIGSDITETMRFVERQTEALFFTENDGFALIDDKANKTLSLT